MAFIEIEGVTYAYPAADGAGRPALQKISLEIRAGEYVAIVGANGSGKSTLARHLNALLIPDRGQVRVGDRDTRERLHRPAIHRTVGMVFQRPEDQLVATTVEEDVAFGPENLGLPPTEIRRRVAEALAVTEMEEVRTRAPHHLSAGQMQRVALAGVLAMRPACIVFDEATAMLDPAGRRAVRRMMARLHAEGITVVTITHFMEEAAEAERVIVLDGGRVAMDAPPRSIFAEPARLAAVGLDLPPAAELARRLRSHCPSLPPEILTIEELAEALDRYRPDGGSLPLPESHARAGLPVHPFVEVEALGHTYLKDTPRAHRALESVWLEVAESAAHGLLGATGSGKSTLMQHLNGLLRPQEGRVRVGPFDLTDPGVDLRAVRRMAGLAFQMPEMQIFEQYVGDEIAYGPRLQGLPRPELRERVRRAMTLVGLDFDAYKDRFTFNLSGGEKRKVALASVLAMEPRLLLLDEPTAGLDPASRSELLDRLAGLREAGITLVISSHCMEDLAALTERLTVLSEGREAFGGAVSEVFTRGDELRALRLDVPPATRLAEALQARGWPLEALPPDPETLIAQLTALANRAACPPC